MLLKGAFKLPADTRQTGIGLKPTPGVGTSDQHRVDTIFPENTGYFKARHICEVECNKHGIVFEANAQVNSVFAIFRDIGAALAGL